MFHMKHAITSVAKYAAYFMTEYEHVGHEVSKLFLLARDIINNKYAHRLDEPGCVGQGMGGCREGTVRPSQLRAGFPPANKRIILIFLRSVNPIHKKFTSIKNLSTDIFKK